MTDTILVRQRNPMRWYAEPVQFPTETKWRLTAIGTEELLEPVVFTVSDEDFQRDFERVEEDVPFMGRAS